MIGLDENNFILTTNLTVELEKTNHALNQWYERKIQSMQKTDSEYKTVMAECETKGKVLYETNEQLENARPINQMIKEQQKRELENVKQIHHQNRLQVQSMTTYLKEMEILEAQLIEKQNLIKKEHDYLKKGMEQKLQDFTHGTKFYSKLGLEFQKATGDCMKFVFTQIDKNDPLRAFHFTIFVNNKNLYEIVETCPLLPETITTDFLQSLNEKNNIGQFVVQMRKAFINLCQE